MGLKSGSSFILPSIVALVAAAACSVVNAPDEVAETGSSTSTSTSSSSSSSTGTGGGDCGDGDIQDPEECDDNGESATCDDDCTVAECLDGTTNATSGEECDDGGESANCDADCSLRICGDGTTNTVGGEECDDNNTASDDGCSGTCIIEGKCSSPATLNFVGGIADVSWTTSGPSLVTAAACDGQQDIGQGPDRVFVMPLASASNVHIELTGQGWDPVLRMMLAACNPATEVSEGGTADGCSDIGDVGAVEHLDYTALAANTYYILVDGATPGDEGPFDLHVEVN